MSHHHHDYPQGPFDCAILTVSDTRTLENDKSGDLIAEKLAAHTIADRRIVPDEVEAIHTAVQEMAGLARLVVITGGTGIAGRDTTVTAVKPLLEKELPGFGELFRNLSYAEIGAAAMLSAALAGVRDRTVIFLLPGSSNACRLGMEKLILPVLPHLLHELDRQR